MRFTSAKFFALIFSITIVASVAILPTVVYAIEETSIEQQALGKSNALELVGCGGFWNRLTISCIVPQLAYYALYVPAMGLLALTGYIFDFVLALSIDKWFIEQDFVNTLWGVIRDFTNMIFIFILLYTGVQTIFGFGKWQSTIIKVVIIALLVNFSMFFTKVVIDAGNILAVGIYQGIGVEKIAGIDRPHKTAAMTPKAKNGNSVPERTVSATLVNALSPQQFAKLSADNKSGAVTIFIVSAVVCAYAALIFAQASFLFIGRIIAFWFLIAISPFALISMTLPKGNIWGWWTNTLINQSFVAPVFLIFIYFIMTAIAELSGVFSNNIASESYFDKIVVPIVITVMIVYALQRALGFAKEMSGKFGELGAKALGSVMSSIPMGMAMGGGAMLLRSSIGSRAGKLLDSGKLQQMSSNPNSALARFTGRTLHGVAEKAHTSSFDVRNADTMKWATKNAKGAFDVKMELGKGGGKDGYKGVMEKIEKDAKAQAEKMKVTGTEKEIQASKMDPKYKEAKEQEEKNQKTLDEASTTHRDAESRAKRTKEWMEKENIEENVKTATTSFKSTEAKLVKQIEDLKKKQEAEKWPDEKDKLQEEITKIEEEKKRAQDDLDKEEKKLTDAKEAYNKTEEAKILVEAEIAKGRASDTNERGQKIIKDAEKATEAWEEQENRQRRGYSVENSMNSLLSSNRYFVPKDDRMSVIKKVRKGDSKDKKKQEEFNKNLKKFYEQSEKVTEEKTETKSETKPEEGK